MATSRYAKTAILNFNAQQGTAQATVTIRTAIANGTLNKGKQIILRGAERLDTLAGVHYGEAQYWWIIAAASNIGWGMQAPAGTILYLPALEDVLSLVS